MTMTILRGFAATRRRAGISSGPVAATAVLLALTAMSGAAEAGSAPAAGTHFVNSALGGQIFGYDTDQSGTEGVMSEAITGDNLLNTIAIETFDQNTGKVRIIKKINNTLGDFVTLGVVGAGIGLVDSQREKQVLHRLPDKFPLLNPLSANQITGKWTPSLTHLEFILGVSESQGSPNAVVLAYRDVIHPFFQSFVFSTNVATNVSGPKIQLTDDVFRGTNGPVVALNTATNIAVVGAGFTTPELAIVDLTKSTVSEFTGLGAGGINEIAVDSADNIACTTTQEDGVEFYDLATLKGKRETLKGAQGDLQAGADVQYDAVNGLFLILQPDCSEGSASCIEIYTKQGKWVKAVAGLTLAQGLVTRQHIAFNPNTRTGFVQSQASQLESFAY
jgi:hypothetical protein